MTQKKTESLRFYTRATTGDLTSYTHIEYGTSELNKPELIIEGFEDYINNACERICDALKLGFDTNKHSIISKATKLINKGYEIANYDIGLSFDGSYDDYYEDDNRSLELNYFISLIEFDETYEKRIKRENKKKEKELREKNLQELTKIDDNVEFELYKRLKAKYG